MIYSEYLKSNRKTILKIAFGALFIGLGIYFFRSERSELSQVRWVLARAEKGFLFLGLVLVVLFAIVQGWMYQYSYRAVGKKIPFVPATLLYLKRNFVSVFLPAGMVSNIFFFNTTIEEKYGVEKMYSYYASIIFSVCSVVSSILIAIPALIIFAVKGAVLGDLMTGILVCVLILLFFGYVLYDFGKKGSIYVKLAKKAPKFIVAYDELRAYPVKKDEVLKVMLFSCVIEVIGVAHLYIAMLALRLEPSLAVAVMGYALVLVILLSAPLLKGIGVIELALTYALTLFGFSAVSALSVTFLFRLFDFWGVLLLGLFAFTAKRDNLLFRVFPPFLLVVLGLVNIFSAVTPALQGRMVYLKQVVPMAAIQASTWFVLFAGIVMIMLAVYLFRGLRRAWQIALGLTVLSLVAHLVKGIDWEEAILAGVTSIFLLLSRKQYLRKERTPVKRELWFPLLISFVAVLFFGTLGFYLLDARHFNSNFNLWESFQETFTAFFLLNVDLGPVTVFGRSFLFSIHILGFSTMLFWIYLLLRTFLRQRELSQEADRQLALSLVKKQGHGSLDYFKT